MAEKRNAQNLLLSFLEQVEKIPSDLNKALIGIATDEDEKNIINTFAPILENQFKELTSFVKTASKRSSLNSQSEVEQFLKTSSGIDVANNLKLSLPSIGSIFGKFGIVEIIQTIKKILDKILDIFGWKPKWLEALLLIIDEILNTLLGGKSIKVKNALSQVEQNFLAERRQVILLEKANEAIYNFGEDED